MEPKDEHHPLQKKLLHLRDHYKELLGRHRYLIEQLTNIQTKWKQTQSDSPEGIEAEEKIDAIGRRLQQLQHDPWLDKLFSAAQNESQVQEIEKYMQTWGVGKPEQKFSSPAHCMVRHANKHGGGNILKYLRKANSFNKRRARSRWVEGAKRWNKRNGEFLIERDGKIVSYGLNLI